MSMATTTDPIIFIPDGLLQPRTTDDYNTWTDFLLQFLERDPYNFVQYYKTKIQMVRDGDYNEFDKLSEVIDGDFIARCLDPFGPSRRDLNDNSFLYRF